LPAQPVEMAPPLVVGLPKRKIVIGALGGAAFSGGGVYLLARHHSVFDLVVGALLLLVFAPNVAAAVWALRRNYEPLTIDGEGLEVPPLGRIRWAEITALRVDEGGLDLKTERGDVQVPRVRMNVNAKVLLDAIAARSGGSWFSGQWTSRAS